MTLEPVWVGRGAAGLTVRRYSTARSGLKKAARMARSMSALAKPMLSMLAMAASRSPPIVRAEGSLKRSPEAWAGAGEGVAGAVCVFDEGAGAAGAEGVWAAAGAGVEGAALLDDAAAALGLETMQTMKPFSSMLYDSTVFASCRILPISSY
jgi:hypothetical protein